MPDCAYVAEVFLGLLAAAQRANQPSAELARQARRACATLRSFARAFPIAWPRAYFWSAVERSQRGHAPAAERLWQKARAAARRFSMPADLAFIDAHSALARGRADG